MAQIARTLAAFIQENIPGARGDGRLIVATVDLDGIQIQSVYSLEARRRNSNVLSARHAENAYATGRRESATASAGRVVARGN